MSRKNLFDINLDNKNGLLDAEDFITRTLDEEIKDKQAKLFDEYCKASSKNLIKGMSKPGILLFTVSFGIFALNRRINFIETETLRLICYGILAIIVIFMRFVKLPSKKHSKDPKPSKKMIELDKQLGELNKLIEKELGVSDDAKDTEVFLNIYDEEESNLVNDKAKIFEEGENLCIYYDAHVLSVKKESFYEIVKINEEVYLDDWYKDVPYDRGRYMQYKIQKVDDKAKGLHREYKMCGYYSLRFSQDEREYEILVPLYDIEPFADALRLSPKEIY